MTYRVQTDVVFIYLQSRYFLNHISIHIFPTNYISWWLNMVVKHWWLVLNLILLVDGLLLIKSFGFLNISLQKSHRTKRMQNTDIMCECMMYLFTKCSLSTYCILAVVILAVSQLWSLSSWMLVNSWHLFNPYCMPGILWSTLHH